MLKIIETANVETLDHIIEAINEELRSRGVEVPCYE